MKKKLLIRDLTLRDGQQSLFATRMNQAQVERVLPFFKSAGFYAMEVWGGAVPDSVMRYLAEDPWERLEKIKAGIGDNTLLTALSRGRNLFGYNPYPEEVIEGFNRNAVKSGIGIMRIFDALNDTENIRSTIQYVKENGGLADATICYTIDPHFTLRDRFRAAFHGKMLRGKIFTKDYFLEKAKELEAMGADMISIKDMAGLIPPGKTGRLVAMLKQELKVPVDFHTHCTPGYGLASALMAIVNGVDIVDTAIGCFSGGPAAPTFELVQIFCDKLGIDTGVNLEAVALINEELIEIRKEMKDFDSYGLFPIPFNISNYKLSPEIDRLFDDAIAYAKQDKEDDLLRATQQIEKHFNFPGPDIDVQNAEIPGGMYTNMLAQLKQLKLEQLLPRVLEIIPTVRMAAGCPPLVTPTSQIVGVQAVNCVIDENKNQPFYTTKSIQFVNLVKGLYGKTPVPVDPDFREKIAGVREETAYDTSAYEKQPNTYFPEYGNVKLAANEKEELLLELFPAVAHDFLKKRIEDAYNRRIRSEKEQQELQYRKSRAEYERLTPEEKMQRLIDGLNNYVWSTKP